MNTLLPLQSGHHIDIMPPLGHRLGVHTPCLLSSSHPLRRHHPLAPSWPSPAAAAAAAASRPRPLSSPSVHKLGISISCSAAASPVLPSPPPQHTVINPFLARSFRLLSTILVGSAATLVAFYLLSGTAIFISSSLTPTSTPSLPLLASLSLRTATPPLSTEALATAIKSASAGLAAGCLHTLAGADHLAALTPLTIGRSHLQASLLGALWGFGHSTGQLILGLLMVVLKDKFTALVPALSKWGGTTVGLTLLAIGAIGIYEAYFEEDHAHDGADDEKEKEEGGETAAVLPPLPQVDALALSTGGTGSVASLSTSASTITVGDGTRSAVTTTAATTTTTKKNKFGIATFATGIVYGLQPDALFVIVPALALPTKLAAVAYIIMFVLGTVAAMGAYTGVIGATSAAIKKSNSALTKKLSGVAAVVAIAIGVGVLASGWGVSIPWVSAH